MAIETKEGKFTYDKYIRSFKWDESRFPRSVQLQEIVKAMNTRVHLLDSDIKQKTNLYLEARNASAQMAKKEGNLYTKDLVDVLKEPLVKASDFVYSEFLNTIIAIVPQTYVGEWSKNYERLTENVVPYSGKQFRLEDKDNLTIWKVVLLKIPLEIKNNVIPMVKAKKMNEEKDQDIEKKEEKKEIDLSQENEKIQTPLDIFSQKAREKYKTVIREFEFKPNESKERERQRLEISSKANTSTVTLKNSCEKAFSDLYIAYIHLKYLRFLVDIIMRFGVNENLFTCVIQPHPGKEKKITEGLLKLFSDPSEIGLYGTKEELDDSEDFFPFIYIPINTF